MTQHSEASEPTESVPFDKGASVPARGGRGDRRAVDREAVDGRSIRPGPADGGRADEGPAGPESPGSRRPAPESDQSVQRITGGTDARMPVPGSTDSGPVTSGATDHDITGKASPDRETAPAEPVDATDTVLTLGHAGWTEGRGSGGPGTPGADAGVPGAIADGRAGGAPMAPGHIGIATGALAEQVTLRSAAELADALPYLLGYRPENSIVLVTVHDRHGFGSFGGRARLGIPARPEDWPAVARQLARALVSGCERRGTRPEGMVAFLCREPESGRSGREVMEALRPLAQLLRTESGSLDVPVLEALCISDGRFWSYCCPGTQCCPGDGTTMGLPGSSVLSAAMTYAGYQVRGTLKEFHARLTPWETAAALDQQAALDAAGMTLAPQILDDAHRADVAADTLGLGRRLIGRLARAPRVHGTLEADRQDDELIAHDEAAALIFGLQDRTTRDRAAEWMEGEVAAPALRLWRVLARRCVGPYGEYAAAPLTLAGWVAWSSGDELEAREALAMALGANPDYTLARLLHQACNEGVSPEAIRWCLRGERAARSATPPGHVAEEGGEATAETPEAAAGAGPAGSGPAGGRAEQAAPEGGGPRPVSGAAAEQGAPPPADRTARPEGGGTAPPGTDRDRPRRSGVRSAARRGPRPTRPPRGRTAGTSLGTSRPPRRRATGRG